MARIPRPEELERELPPRPKTIDEGWNFLRLFATVTQKWNCDMDLLVISIETKDMEQDPFYFKRSIEMAPGDARKVAGARLLKAAQQAHTFLKRVNDGTLFEDDEDA